MSDAYEVLVKVEDQGAVVLYRDAVVRACKPLKWALGLTADGLRAEIKARSWRATQRRVDRGQLVSLGGPPDVAVQDEAEGDGAATRVRGAGTGNAGGSPRNGARTRRSVSPKPAASTAILA